MLGQVNVSFDTNLLLNIAPDPCSFSRWGTVDVRRVDSKTALVAVGNGAAAEGVILFFDQKLLLLFNCFKGCGLLAEGERHDSGKIQCASPL